MMGNIKDKVAIVGMGCTKFAENWEMSLADMLIDATYEALADAKVELKDIEAGWIGTLMGGMTGGMLTEALQWNNVPVTRVENNCAAGLESLRAGALAIASGMYDIVLVTGVEKCKDTGTGSLTFPYGYHEVYGYMQAPAAYATAALRYFEKYGIPVEQGRELLSKIAVKNHHNGSFSPKAHFQREISMEQALKAPIIAWPLGLFDCCPTTDGAAAAVLVRADLAPKFRDDYVLIKGIGLALGRRNVYSGRVKDAMDSDYTIWNETVAAAKQAYDQVGIKNPRKEITIASVHDCFTITELINYESLGLSPVGKAKEDVASGFFELNGELPVNTDGGLKAFGHPVGASGLRMVYELYKQIQGKAGKRQIKNPGLGLAHCQGGNPTGGFQAGVVIVGPRD
jgi:acetyl-CoA C-acetyltransferase